MTRPERWIGPPCGCERAGEHDGCAVDRARLRDLARELLDVLEPREPDPCIGRCHAMDFDAIRWAVSQYGICPCWVAAGRAPGGER